MTRRRPQRRPVSRGRRYYDEYDEYSYHPRRRREGCLAPIKRFFRTVAIVLLTALGAIVFFLVVLLIAFNFQTFVQILYYALFVGAGLAILGVLYVIVRIITEISHRISAASAARSKAKLERERVRMEQERVQQARAQVQQARVQARSQQAKLARDDYAFYHKYEQPGLSQSPRRTRVIRDDLDQDLPAPPSRNMQSPYRTRNLRDSAYQEPLVRVLPALSSIPSEPEPTPPPETELEALGMPPKGHVFPYRTYNNALKPGQKIVGIRKDGSPRIGSRQDFKITLVLGASSSGKSTTVLQECLCVVNEGGLLNVCDPGGFKPDSITQRMGALSLALMPGTTVALEHDDIMHNLECFRVELERRRRGADMSAPLLLVIDELNGLLMDKEIKKDLTELIEKFGQQARGYNMYMILCAQRASGLAAIRNSVISFICHKCPEMEASKILPARYAKLAPELGTGQTFVTDADGNIEPLQQIFISPQDIAESCGGRRLPTQPRPQTEPIGPKVYGAPSRKIAAMPPQQKLVLRRTNLVQDQSVAIAQPSPPVPQPTAAASAIWGEDTILVSEETVVKELAALQSPALPASPATRETEDLNQRSAAQRSQPATQPELQPRQDTFEMLALRLRAKKKK